jgi:enterochelin esterase family protein
VHAQETLKFGVSVTGGLTGGESRRYAFDAAAGDQIVGPAELIGSEGWLQFLDGSGGEIDGIRVRQWPLGDTPSRRVGFVAPASATYQVRITASGTAGATYSLRLERLAVSDRMRGVSVTPREVHTSERIRQLSRDVQQGRRDAVSQFWRDVTGHGPLVESAQGNEQDLLVTFLWRETFETHNVLVGWPMAVFRAQDYYMSRLANTDVWYKTIQVRRGSRFSYWLSPNDRPGDFLSTARLDPLNPLVFPDSPGAMQDRNSVLDTAEAPDETWFRRTPARRGVVAQQTFKSELLNNVRDIWVYTPPGYAPSAGPYPLVVLFDGFQYVSAAWNNAPATLDNLISDGRMRPTIVCFLDSVDRGIEQGYVGADTYGDAIVRELLPQLRSTYAVSTSARDTVIGGFSAGALAASLIALRHSDVFGNVLSQSGAFRLRKPGGDEPTSIAQMWVAAPRLPVRFYLETGLYENMPSANLPLHEMALDEGITTSNRHFRDVLMAKGYDVTYRETATAHESIHWRSTLADALTTLLKP